TTTAPINGQLTGGNNVTVRATTTHADTTTAKTGAFGGNVTVAPAIAVVISNVTTTASIAGGTALSVTGAVEVKAEQSASALTDAQGDTKGKKVAIGVALALTIAHHTALASINRNVTAGGAVSVLAFGSSATASDATASARGAPGDATSGAASGGVTKQVGDQRDLGNTKASESGSTGGGNSTSGDGSSAKTETSSGP